MMPAPRAPGSLVWASSVTAEMVEGWTDEEVADLVADLDRIVMVTVEDHEAQRARG